MQWNIPTVCTNGCLLLELVGKPNEFWFVQASAPAKECKAAVVVRFAHAETVPAAIKCNKRREYQVEVAGFNQSASFRFRNTVAVENQAFTGFETGKPEFILRKGCEYWQIQLFSEPPKPLNKRPRIDFTVRCQVDGDMAIACSKMAGADVPRQKFGATPGVERLNAASLLANSLAQLIAAGHRQGCDACSRPGVAGFYIIRRASSTCAGAAIALEPEVQEGDGSDATGSPHMADMHKASGLVPWIEK